MPPVPRISVRFLRSASLYVCSAMGIETPAPVFSIRASATSNHSISVQEHVAAPGGDGEAGDPPAHFPAPARRQSKEGRGFQPSRVARLKGSRSIRQRLVSQAETGLSAPRSQRDSKGRLYSARSVA